MTFAIESTRAMSLEEAFCRVRRQSLKLCEPLSAEDMMVQSCADASPAKWHLAHTTWFFETFVLREFLPGYKEYDSDFRWLFNSYYNAVSGQPEKKLRSLFSRPGLQAILDYRRHVEDGIQRLIGRACADPADETSRRITLGLHHEQQHQELLATDIKHAFWSNPLRPAYLSGGLESGAGLPVAWVEYGGGLFDIGSDGESFAFDCELPRHPEYLQPFRLASRVVTCAEYLEFIEDGGYRRQEHWLSAGWDMAQAEGWQAPLYWRLDDGVWRVYTTHGEAALDDLMTTPVCHVSYFEADAFAKWAHRRLPREAEWEVAAAALPVEGNFLEAGQLHPCSAPQPPANQPAQIFGDVWEWTQSAFTGYPGFRPAPGALGEYNGKFMSGQMVLRGGSAATPASHIRASYRNFFPPATRWQFSGIRLAEP